jgi:hypothetical protein
MASQSKTRPPRRCDIPGCPRPVRRDGFEPWCSLHRSRAWRHGDPRQPRSINWKDVAPVLPLVQEYLRQNPPPADVLEKVYERVLSPSASFDIAHREPHWTRRVYRSATGLIEAKRKLHVLMTWWRCPESAYSGHLHGQPQRQKRTLPAPPWFVLRVLLAVEMFVTERQWGVGYVPELSRAEMLLRIRKRRPTGGTTRPSHLARKLLAQVISESIGVYLLREAPKVIAQMNELRQAVAALVNKKGTRGGPRRTKVQLEEMEKARRERMRPTELITNPEPVTDDTFSRWLKETFSNERR